MATLVMYPGDSGLRASAATLDARIDHFRAPHDGSSALARGERGGRVVSLRAGLIGLGAMGRHHARVLSELDGVEFVGVLEPAGEPGRSARGVPVVRDVAGLLALGLDYAVVACPTAVHEEIGVQLAAAGVCALIEKPLADSVPAAARLVGAFEAAGLVAGVGHIERYNPALQSLRARLEAGALGEVFQVVTRRQGPFPHRVSDVGVVKDLATHDIDLTGWVTGQEYASVSARTVSKSGRPHEDMVAVVGQLTDGTMVNHLVNWLSPLKERSTVVTGELGCFVADTLTADLTFYANGARDTEWEALRAFRGVSEGDMIRYAIAKREPLLVEHERFRDAVRGVGEDIVTLRQGLRTVEVSLVVLDSARLGVTMEVGPPGAAAGSGAGGGRHGQGDGKLHVG
jgi:predicted dehydrogenase